VMLLPIADHLMGTAGWDWTAGAMASASAAQAAVAMEIPGNVEMTAELRIMAPPMSRRRGHCQYSQSAY
jgi:hypothetical protein